MNPSLLLIPDRYKASKLYSQIPDSGAGDLAFTRANDTATRVNSEGLIEKVRTNLLAYSEEFTTANGWGAGVIGASTATQTSNYGIAPNGTMTADRIQLALNGDAYADWVRPTAGFVIGQSYTYSIYLKSLTGVTTLEFFNDGAGGVLKTITTEWVRYTHSFTASSATIFPRFLLIVTTSSTADLLAWGYQLETGDIATPYIPTTTAAVSVGPVANIPRIDYTGGGCGKLLLEPQRTNIALYSEQFNNAAYTKNNLTVTANNLVSPDGYTNADTAFETAFDGFHDLLQSPSLTSGTTYTLSSFVKAAGRDYCYLFLSDGTTPAAVKFNLATGVVLGTALGSPVSSKIENYGNGWYRCSMVYTSAATATGTLAVSATNSPALSLSGYAGDITKGIAVYGCQLEAGSYPTSYIPTLGASVTRSADAASKTGISSLIGQTEGTLFGELKVTAYDTNGFIPVLLKNATATSEIYVWFQQNGNVMGRVFNSASDQAQINTGAGFATIGGTYKFAMAYKQNDFAFYINGQQIGTDTNGTVQPTSEFYFTYNQLADYSFPLNISQTLLFTTRLSNSELASLTSL